MAAMSLSSHSLGIATQELKTIMLDTIPVFSYQQNLISPSQL
jgi:hypothetical protein